VNAELGRYVMEQTIAKVLFHTGFEGTSYLYSKLNVDFHPSAFDIITGVAIEYLQELGRTLRLYMNSNDGRKKYSEEVGSSSRRYSFQELIMHALDLNGVQDLERLDVYIKDDIERYGTKLEDCHRRLKRFLTELLVRFPIVRSNYSVLHSRKAKMGRISLMIRTRVLSVEISPMNWVRISLVSENWG